MKRMDGPYHETTHDGKEVVPQTVQNRIFIRKAEPAYPVPAPVPQPQKKTILGLQRVNFLLIIALIVVIMAAGVGGGVGGSLAVKNAKKYIYSSLKDMSTYVHLPIAWLTIDHYTVRVKLQPAMKQLWNHLVAQSRRNHLAAKPRPAQLPRTTQQQQQQHPHPVWLFPRTS